MERIIYIQITNNNTEKVEVVEQVETILENPVEEVYENIEE